jgi:hypothetical protein
MPYKSAQHPDFAKDVHKLTKKNKPLKQVLKAQVLAILDNPALAEPYTGNLLGLSKVAFGKGPEYRIIIARYACCEQRDGTCLYGDDSDIVCEGFIDFIRVMSREDANNFYKKSISYIEQLLR